jgi:thymus-specific serine protease
MKQVLYIIQIVLLMHFTSGININGFIYLTRELNDYMTATSDKSSIKTRWIEQPLNHFDSQDSRTWNMRYFERHDLWKPDKPVYLFLGGEGPSSPGFLKTGLMYDLAKETGGAMYVSEHRYYGKSKPFQNFTAETLKYLSSRQALADIARLLEMIKASPEFKSSKVVVIGGSYSGNLAAWMKLLYPNLVDAAVASSAPVLAKADFYEYLETVSDDFEQHGTLECWDKIAERFSRYETLFKSEDGIKILKDEEHICGDCNMQDPKNRQTFFLDKASEFMGRAQYGSTGIIKKYCESNFSSSFRNFKDSTFNWNQKNECWCYDFDEMIESIKNIDWYTAWIWQTCTEFGYYQTSTSSENHPFTENDPVEFHYNMCKNMFGDEYGETTVEKGVKETHSMYGGLKPNVTNVVFVNGGLDPWSRLSVLKDISENAPAKIISATSHCKDLLSDTHDDPKELKETRANIRHLIKK